MIRGEWKEIHKKIKQAGFDIVPHKGHYKVLRGDRYVYTMPGSSSDHRAVLNTRSQIRKYLGVEV